MATHSTILAWKTPWTEEPGGSPTCWTRLSKQLLKSGRKYGTKW